MNGTIGYCAIAVWRGPGWYMGGWDSMGDYVSMWVDLVAVNWMFYVHPWGMHWMVFEWVVKSALLIYMQVWVCVKGWIIIICFTITSEGSWLSLYFVHACQQVPLVYSIPMQWTWCAPANTENYVHAPKLFLNLCYIPLLWVLVDRSLKATNWLTTCCVYLW